MAITPPATGSTQTRLDHPLVGGSSTMVEP